MTTKGGGFEKFTLDDYEITPQGEIYNKKWNRTTPVKPQLNDKGYLRVSIGGKLCFVHRLVAQKYIPNPENKPQVNHKDGNKLNNSVENLEWVTNKENREHALNNGLHLCGDRCPWAKISDEDVKFIRAHTELTNKELAEKFHLSVRYIRDIRKMKERKYN